MWKTRIIALLLIVAGLGIGYFNYASQFKPESKVAKFPFKLGLDLNGGTHLVYQADVSKLDKKDISVSMDALRNVIEARVNLFGVSEPIVQVEEGGVLGNVATDQKLIVELPGVTDVATAVALIGKTPLLDFKILKDSDRAEFAKREEAVRLAIDGVQINGEAATTAVIQKLKPANELFINTQLTGRLLQRAQLEFNGTTGEPVVSLVFNTEGKELFAKITKENVGNILAIFLDGRAISLPVVRQEILDGKAQISGGFTTKEAQSLVRDLNYGALPVPIELLSTQTVGASLGQDALAGGVKAGALAFLVVSIFLIIWYRLPGALAVLSLAMYSVIMLAIFKLIPVTLTAAGIAGFILSIGMAVDANILIFERMKEEIARGTNVYDAIREGFARAWFSIRDGNLSSIITALVLYYLSNTSVVKGFALIFGIGVLVSMFTAITVSRTFLLAVATKGNGKVMRFLLNNGFRRAKVAKA